MKSYESDNNSAKNGIYFGYSEERDRGYAPDMAFTSLLPCARPGRPIRFRGSDK